jgi:hypothetical protein
MRFVYATRPLPKLEFATADRRDALPLDAEVYAVSEGALTIRRQEESVLSPLTAKEQAALEEQITNSTPGISINDLALAEGNSGLANFTFAVSLSAASNQTITVSP